MSERFSRRILCRAAIGCALVASLTFAASARAADKPLRIGLASSISNQAIEIAVKEAKAQGLDVNLIEFNDWNTPNRAV